MGSDQEMATLSMEVKINGWKDQKLCATGKYKCIILVYDFVQKIPCSPATSCDDLIKCNLNKKQNLAWSFFLLMTT